MAGSKTAKPASKSKSARKPSKPTTKAAAKQSTTSKVAASKTPTSKAATSKAATSKAATSKAATSKAATTNAAASKTPTSKAATSKAAASKTPTSKAATSKGATSKAATSKAAAPSAAVTASERIEKLGYRFGAAELRELVTALAGTTTPVRVTASEPAGVFSWDRQLRDPAIIEALLAAGVPLQVPAGEPETYTFWLEQWRTRDLAEDALPHVIAHPFFGRVLVNSFLPSRESKDNAGNWLERAAAHASFAPVLATLAARIRELCERWTLGALEVHGAWLESLLRPAILARMPALVDVVRALTPARLLCAQLRGGVMDEWGWPAQDEALARLGEKPAWGTGGPAPYFAYYGRTAQRVIAFGPDGILVDRVLDEDPNDLRAVYYARATDSNAPVGDSDNTPSDNAASDNAASGGASDDVLLCSYPSPARWLAGGDAIACGPVGFFGVATADGALLSRKLARVRPGETELRGDSGGDRVWFDGERYYAMPFSAERMPASGVVDARTRLVAFDPATGATRPSALPPWLAAQLHAPDDVVFCELTHLMPTTSTTSPLPARDGVGGGALVTRAHQLRYVSIDGRSCSGWVNGRLVGGLVRFPERVGDYPLIARGEKGIALPDGTTPLVPADQLAPPYWTQPLPLAQWYSLRPRDPAGSRALAACTEATAQALLAEAVAPSVETPRVLDYGTLQATLTPPARATIADTAAVARALPEVTHPQLQQAIAQLAAHATLLAPKLQRMQGRIATALAPTVKSSFVNKDATSYAALIEHEMHWWVEREGLQLGQQMFDVAHYLCTDDTLEPRTPAATKFPWETLLWRSGEVLYRVLASATPRSHREQLAALLAVWREVGLCDQRLRAYEVSLPSDSPALVGVSHTSPDRLAAWTNRYFLRWRGREGDRVRMLAIEATRNGTFRVPDGGELLEEVALDLRFDRAAIDRALALYREHGRVEYDASLVAIVAERTGLSRAAAALAWGAGFDPWLVGDTARTRMQITRPELDVADAELRGKPLREIYAAAMPADPAHAFTVEGAQQFADAWLARFKS